MRRARTVTANSSSADSRGENHPVEKPDPRLMATAYHEAGHAVVATLVGRTVKKVTIVPSKPHLGRVRLGVCKMEKGRAKASKDWVEDEVLILFAGMVAEARFTKRYAPEGAAKDLQAIRMLLQNRAPNERAMERLEKRLLQKTEHLLSDEQTMQAVKRIAAELVDKQTVSGRAVRHFLQQGG